MSDVPGHGCKEHDFVLDSDDSVSGGCIDDQATMLSGIGQIHIIDSNTSSSNNFQPRATRSTLSIPK